MAVSMTGFGRGEYKDDNYYFLVELKTINHKYAEKISRRCYNEM